MPEAETPVKARVQPGAILKEDWCAEVSDSANLAICWLPVP